GLFSIGGQATLELEGAHDEAIRIINRALDLGVNYIDTAPLYGGGASERYIGEALKGRRNDAFLASKTDDRSYDGSMRSLEGSLKRLGTDHLDLWQIHNVQTSSDVDFILSRQGAVRALERAKDEGIVRFTGITGHRDPFVLKRAIESHPFDAILMAINPADRHSASFIDNLLPTAVRLNMGIMAMKVPSRGKIFRQGGVTTMELAMRYALSHPVSTLVIGISAIRELEEDVRIAREFTPLQPAEMAALEDLTKPYFADALWYRDHM
ncbi:MAG TPA: aldo/keto reductase, partial [Bacteroidota bacterium]|nr:aldo/keto reductase [Bacteroidota bacterium]